MARSGDQRERGEKRPANEAALPRLALKARRERGLVSVRDVAGIYRVHRSTVVSRLNRPGAPAPVAVGLGSTGQHVLLYRLDEIEAHVEDVFNGHPLGGLGTHRDPLLSTTRTPTAARPYVWRDPARNPDRRQAG